MYAIYLLASGPPECSSVFLTTVRLALDIRLDLIAMAITAMRHSGWPKWPRDVSQPVD